MTVYAAPMLYESLELVTEARRRVVRYEDMMGCKVGN
jgi:hypothetical protein